MQPVPTDLILHALAENLIGMEGNDESLRSLGHTILRTCVDLRALPAQWCNGAGVGQQISWLTRRIVDEDTNPHVAAETRAMEVAISRRLADTAFSLLITQDDGDKTASLTLLEAAHRVVGLPSAEVHAEDTASWQSRVLALEGQLKAAVDLKDAWGRDSNKYRTLYEEWRAWACDVAKSRNGYMPSTDNGLQVLIKDSHTKASTLVAQHEEMYAALCREVNAARDLAAAHLADVKTARDETHALQYKVVTLERDHAALGKVEGNTSMRAYELAQKIDAINEALGIACNASQELTLKTIDGLRQKSYGWGAWARDLLGVDDGTALELQGLITKEVARVNTLRQHDLARADFYKLSGANMSVIASALGLNVNATQGFIVDAIKCYRDASDAIIAALKLDPGASQSDIIETIKNLQADRATLAERVVGDAPVPVEAPRFKVGDRVLISTFGGNSRYATVLHNDATSPPASPFGVKFSERLCLVRFDDDNEAYITEHRLKDLPKVDP